MVNIFGLLSVEVIFTIFFREWLNCSHKCFDNLPEFRYPFALFLGKLQWDNKIEVDYVLNHNSWAAIQLAQDVLIPIITYLNFDILLYLCFIWRRDAWTNLLLLLPIQKLGQNIQNDWENMSYPWDTRWFSQSQKYWQIMCELSHYQIVRMAIAAMGLSK